MSRLHQENKWVEKIWYDTHCIEPGQKQLFFSSAGRETHQTNIQFTGHLSIDGAAVVKGIGARLIGKSREDEDLLLDHLHLRFDIGDLPQFDVMGPHASMLRHVYTREELARWEVAADEVAAAHAAPLDKIRAIMGIVPQQGNRMGYRLEKAFPVPWRQRISVWVNASDRLPEAVNLRVHLFGKQSWRG